MTGSMVLDEMTAQGWLEYSDQPHDFVYIDPRCHPHAPIQVAYNSRAHALRIECLECGRTVAEVQLTETK